MDKQDKGVSIERDEERRAFLNKIGKTAVAAPAVTLLLAVGSKQASAAKPYQD